MNSCRLEGARCQLGPASQFSWIPAKYASISFLCSNAGGEQINEMTLDLWRAHKDREEISLQDLESAISKAVFENPQSESMSRALSAGSEVGRGSQACSKQPLTSPATSQAARKGQGAFKGRKL